MPEKRLEVLMVDDEPDVCWALERLLGKSGLAGIVARDAREALPLVRPGRFQLVFLDAKLPDVEGLEVARRIRLIDPAVRIVLVSGYFCAEDRTVQQALASGLVNAFVGKPFRNEEIVEIAREGTRALRNRSLTSGGAAMERAP